jgi:molybdenum cofactor guanylyltransferase
MTSIILAGGKSRRLGQRKALQTILGRTLIQWVIDRLALISTEIIIATAHGEEIPCSSPVPTRAVADIYPDRGPLAGIHSGLTASSCPRAIVVGCDTPFLNVELLRHMSKISPVFDVVVPRIADKVEPLCAVYSRNCLTSVEALLTQNEMRITRLFALVRTRYVEEEEIGCFDPEHLSFINTNSRVDLDAARKLAIEKGLLHAGHKSVFRPAPPAA